MLVTCEEMKRAEEAAFARGVQAEDLMEEAGRGIAEIVRQFHASQGSVSCSAAKATMPETGWWPRGILPDWGWSIDVQFAYPESALSPLTAKKLKELPKWPGRPSGRGSKVVLDGLARNRRARRTAWRNGGGDPVDEPSATR